ncbi:hypothetical protein EO087_01580 [Dyella sp. M7H15-1]|uniref:hypothetical protein n=1 Tax=Dyella sp. M7H15-1 TaxID=2501295 RepID=UPI001004F318|nr:hypothetical protein [Dyella sp. M7H15-1]QAU22837.1 hypothetical protein EO087_01580 [Dyella sp. M7H15-1]
MAVPLLAGGIMALCDVAGALTVAGATGAAGGGVDGWEFPSPPAEGAAPLLPLGLLHPPMANPIQATAMPNTMRFMKFLLK